MNASKTEASPGTAELPTDTLSFAIRAAASAVQAGGSQQPSINTATQFLTLLKLNETALSTTLAQSFSKEFDYSQIATRRGPEYTKETLLLAFAAGLPQAVGQAFALVYDTLQHSRRI